MTIPILYFVKQPTIIKIIKTFICHEQVEKLQYIRELYTLYILNHLKKLNIQTYE